MTEIIGLLITISAFDLGEGKIECFSAYHFLYERLLGPSVRPWLPSAFVGAASLPYIHPSLRKALLSSITAGEMAAIDWSNFDPVFFPEWVDEVEITPSQPCVTGGRPRLDQRVNAPPQGRGKHGRAP